MSRIIDLNEFKSHRTHKHAKVEVSEEGAFYDTVNHFEQMLDDKEALLEFMAEETESFIFEEHMNPDDFRLSKSYFKDFLLTDIDLDDPSEDTYVELVFHWVSEERIVSVCTYAVPEESGEIHLSHQMYALEHYKEGNRSFSMYNFDDHRWQADQGEDYFDVDVVLREYKE